MAVKTPQAAGESAPAGTAFVADVLARNLRNYRLLHNMEQDLVANRMWGFGHDWRRVTVSEIERGRRNVTVPELLSLTVVLDVTVEALLDPRGPERRGGPQLLLAAGLSRQAPRHHRLTAVDGEHVADLVCGHRGRVSFDWLGSPGIRYTGPEGAASIGKQLGEWAPG